ncbi:hypothetical protein [Streptomyces sp. ISL-98]|uniref:hypothetical protein n=1 Tax=Streptomyces sp. ISL-98 TaxID=2819192 RepID=UPI002034B564|nr:hypothetical protein [Streptomyces sp. ISL-98]
MIDVDEGQQGLQVAAEVRIAHDPGGLAVSGRAAGNEHEACAGASEAGDPRLVRALGRQQPQRPGRPEHAGRLGRPHGDVGLAQVGLGGLGGRCAVAQPGLERELAVGGGEDALDHAGACGLPVGQVPRGVFAQLTHFAVRREADPREHVLAQRMLGVGGDGGQGGPDGNVARVVDLHRRGAGEKLAAAGRDDVACDGWHDFGPGADVA